MIRRLFCDALSAAVMEALANERRLLTWLKDPIAHFPAQRDGDLARDGEPRAAHLDVDGLQPRNEPRIREIKQSFRTGC